LSLEEGLRRLVEMLQYKQGWYSIELATNREAAQWVAANRKLLPVGQKSLVIEPPSQQEADTELDLPSDEPETTEETIEEEAAEAETEQEPQQEPAAPPAERVQIQIETEDSVAELRVPASMTPAGLTAAVVPQLAMRLAGPDGKPIRYIWTLRRTGQALVDDRPLGEQGVADGDVLEPGAGEAS
jgi:hypothetical protein